LRKDFLTFYPEILHSGNANHSVLERYFLPKCLLGKGLAGIAFACVPGILDS
jgi:hypothetical protein